MVETGLKPMNVRDAVTSFPTNPKIGFIGLGNVGGKLAGSLMRNKCQLMVRDLDKTVAQPFIDAGVSWADSPKIMAEKKYSKPEKLKK